MSNRTAIFETWKILRRQGNLGQFGSPPTAYLEREVFYASPSGSGSANGLTAKDSIAGADNGYNLLTASRGDVLICLPGDYSNELVTLDKAYTHIYGPGLGQCEGIRFVLSANSIELAGFQVDYSSENAHGINIVDSNNSWIHHNLIKDIVGAYDGIDKSSGSVIEGLLIEHNVITNCGSGGIGLVNVIESTIRDNWVYKNVAEGIILNATCDYNRIINNHVFENNEGIELQGDHNHLIDNVVKGNGVLDIVDSGTYNRWSNTKGVIQSGVHTRTNDDGVGEIDIITNVDTPRSGHVAVVVDTSFLIDGGNSTFRVKDASGNELASSVWIAGTTTVIPTLEFWIESGANKFNISVESTIAVALDRIIGYKIIFGDG